MNDKEMREKERIYEKVLEQEQEEPRRKKTSYTLRYYLAEERYNVYGERS